MTTDNKAVESQEVSSQMEGGTYEVIRERLKVHGKELNSRNGKLNKARKEIFGSIEMSILGNERIITAHNCIPRDLIHIGKKVLLGFNVHLGLKEIVELTDVFAIYDYNEKTFQETTLDLINNSDFEKDFKDLYKYYKNTTFARFSIIGPYLYMVFRTGKNVTDIKTFKWLVDEDKITYVDNRSDHEYKFPLQHEFEWERTNRDQHRAGLHPHISIEDRVFVETVGGDLTIKVEDNTESGRGIYSEDVDNVDQKLDDAEIYYALIGNIIIFKIKPYQEQKYRYLVFNEKIQSVTRIDSIEDACILLPDSQGLVFSNGYYLQSGEYKTFDTTLTDMHFAQKLVSPNGEDFQYVFYNRESGTYAILSYNLINQTIDAPIVCNGYSHFDNGELILFKADEDPKKNHVIQIWQTSFTSSDFKQEVESYSFLVKVGNKEVVQVMAEIQAVVNLIRKEESYANLYVDINKECSSIIDSYFWIEKEDAFNIKETLLEVRDAASSAIDEFEKVIRIKKYTKDEIDRVSEKSQTLLKEVKVTTYDSVDVFVSSLSKLRIIRGEVISLKDLRYTDIPLIDKMEEEIRNKSEELSQNCIEYLLKPEGLDPYREKVEEQGSRIESVNKTAEGKELEEEITQTGSDLELLIEIVSNLKIDDPTQTTEIIDSISSIFTSLNQIKAKLKNRISDLSSDEGIAEFGSQMKLLNQAVINYLDVADTPDKCDEYLTKLMVQIEELEGKFSEFDEFIPQLAEKRDELYNAFETRKLALVEKRNKRADALVSASERVIKGIKNRLKNFKSVNEINGYFATDLMIDKVRDNIEKLNELGDSVKADDLQSQLKSTKEEAVRQLKDKLDLFEDGTNVIKFGKHKFSFNTQELDLTMVLRDDEQMFHLTGTDFWYKVENQEIEACRHVWTQEVPSENKNVYRGEYLAYRILEDAKEAKDFSIDELSQKSMEDLTAFIQKYMGSRYQEGYTKGIHDSDAAKILEKLLLLHRKLSLLIFGAEARALAKYYWLYVASEDIKSLYKAKLSGLNLVAKVFGAEKSIKKYASDISNKVRIFCEESPLFNVEYVDEASEYLCRELLSGDQFVISSEANVLFKGFKEILKSKHSEAKFDESLNGLTNNSEASYGLIREWVESYCEELNNPDSNEFIAEVTILLLTDDFNIKNVIDVPTKIKLTEMLGSHDLLDKGCYEISYTGFVDKLKNYDKNVVPAWYDFQEKKKVVADQFRKELRLNEFKPRVLTSFVRNQLIDKVYLPLVGDNFAKQMGTVGENKRTDLMGMLLLISPPGYGKTTLMEYIASRLGIIFMKINGPAIGHQVTSLDPNEAPNAGAREEIEKLNLSLEMGNNVMIYLDDIQHCNPEFLQKFISLCDGQRKIEGVYKGVSKTYDLRGKKVAVVMAGNPYTESGEKFQIPDMLANRADTYNLGDMLSANEDAFKLSYLENSLTSNPVMNSLMTRSSKDVYQLIQVAQTDSKDSLELEGNYSVVEINEYVNVIKKLFTVRNIILDVNMEYIRSAAQADEYRTEPSFKLQGSYRNMNKIAEKVLPVMNDEELMNLVQVNYENDAQTLTSGAEANLLKWKEIVGILEGEDLERWNSIKSTYGKNKLVKEDDKVGQVILQMADMGSALMGIKEVLDQAVQYATTDNSSEVEATEEVLEEVVAEPVEPQHSILEFSSESMSRLEEILTRTMSMANVSQAAPQTDGHSNSEYLQGTMIKLMQENVKIMNEWLEPIFKTTKDSKDGYEKLRTAIYRALWVHRAFIKKLRGGNGDVPPSGSESKS